MSSVALIVSGIANLISFGAVLINFKNIKMLRKAIKERDELIEAKQTFIAESVRVLVSEFFKKDAFLAKKQGEDEGAKQILQQLMRDEHAKQEAILIAKDFMRRFAANDIVTLSESHQWDRAEKLLCHLLGKKHTTWADLAKKSPEERQHYFLSPKTVVA